MKRNHLAGFTLAELLIAALVFSAVTLGLLAFSQVSLRLVSRNLATNHSHDTARLSELKLLQSLHDSASPFVLFTYDGTTFTDLTATVTGDQEPLAQRYVSARSNGVRYRVLAGGPYRLTADTTPSSTSLTFDFSSGGGVPYVPQVGDKVCIPLISRDFSVTAVTVIPTSGSPQGTVTVSSPEGNVGFTIDTTTSGNVTTGYFYRSVAYSVWNGTLRYHPNFTGSNRANTVNVRDRVTSPQPFGLLQDPTTGTIANGALRVSLESYDPNYTNRRFQNGTSTLQTIIPPLANPLPLSNAN